MTQPAPHAERKGTGRRIVWWALGLALAVVAWPSSTARGASPSGPGAGSESGSGAPAPLVVAVGGPAEDTAYLPVHAAAALGTFEAEGLAVQLRRSRHPAAAIALLRSGEASVAVVTLEQAIRGAWARQMPVRVLLAHTRAPAVALVAATTGPRPVTALADLRGRRVGMTGPGTTTHLLLSALLRSARIGIWELTVESLGGATLAGRVAAGGLDAAMLEEPWLGRALAGGKVRVLVDFRDPDETVRRLGGPFHEVVSVARADEETAARLAPQIGAFARAVLRVQAWLSRAAPEAVAARLPAALAPDRPTLIARLAVARAGYAPGGEATTDGLETSLEVLQGASPWPVTLKVGPGDLREPPVVTAARAALGQNPPDP